MDHLVGRKRRAADVHPIPPPLRHEGHARGRHGIKLHQQPAREHWQRHLIALGHQRAHDGLHESLMGHQRIRCDIHHAAQFVLYARIAMLAVFHQVNRHAGDQLGVHVHAHHHLRALRQRPVSIGNQHPPGIIRANRHGRASALPPRRIPAPASLFSVSAHVSNHPSVSVLPISSSMRTVANTSASKISMRRFGCTFSYCTISSVFSMAATFCTQ